MGKLLHQLRIHLFAFLLIGLGMSACVESVENQVQLYDTIFRNSIWPILKTGAYLFGEMIPLLAGTITKK